jgi:hypothetical protein
MTVLEDFGNMVSINGQKIPAGNIQVDNVPGYIYTGDFGAEWYGVYFEILFEQGYLWVVSQRSEFTDDEKIHVAVYSNWARDRESYRNTDADLVIPCAHWDDFLEMYNDKDEYWGAITLPGALSLLGV